MLEEFVAAVTGDDAVRAEAARSLLLEQFGIDWLIDASAVVANFEMMTRLADATGARMRPDQRSRPQHRFERHRASTRSPRR